MDINSDTFIALSVQKLCVIITEVNLALLLSLTEYWLSVVYLTSNKVNTLNQEFGKAKARQSDQIPSE